ncbi:hypothetical protein ACKWTF_003687 [Chironomus riparius]
MHSINKERAFCESREFTLAHLTRVYRMMISILFLGLVQSFICVCNYLWGISIFTIINLHFYPSSHSLRMLFHFFYSCIFIQYFFFIVNLCLAAVTVACCCTLYDDDYYYSYYYFFFLLFVCIKIYQNIFHIHSSAVVLNIPEYILEHENFSFFLSKVFPFHLNFHIIKIIFSCSYFIFLCPSQK